MRKLLGRLLCFIGLHRRGNPVEIPPLFGGHGICVGAGPFRLCTADGRYEADYYVTSVSTMRCVLQTCTRCHRL